MAKKRKKSGGHLKRIAKERTCFSLMQENVPSQCEVGDHRETSANIGAKVVGREMEKQEIMARLFGNTTQKITLLPIYGIGGIGKTTMAQFVCSDSQFKDYSRVWTYVSQTFDLKKIGNSIITQLSGNKSEHTDLQMIENSLQNLLSGKRVLIILDDLWEKQSSKLEKLESMLNLGEGGKVVVVVTTREESIAHKIQTDTVEPYKLAPLTDDICWTIIKNKSSFETRADRAQLELIGKDIANKCGGMALAAQSIGYMLENMEFDEWVSVKNNEIWDALASEESHHVRASLLLSYHRMDSWLKSCFAYCATFPKGHKRAKEDLAYQWIALELVELSKTFSYIQTSHKYIRHLSGMSFLQHPRSSFRTMDDVDKDYLVMHDLVHDLARSVLADKINIESPACQYALVTDHRKLFNSSMNPLAKIRALHFARFHYLQLHGGAFSPSKCLLVLDLSGCHLQELPDSIGQLKELRYLDASCEPTLIPDDLGSELQYLNLSNRLIHNASQESMLIPEALGSLNKLQYLNLSNRRRPIGLPQVIRKLTELRYLNASSCLMRSSSANQSFIDCIGTLPNLEQLDLSSNDYRFSVPECLSSLKKLNLYGCYHISSLPENVTKVDIPRLFGLLDEGFSVRAVDSGSSSSLVWLKHTNPDVLCIVHLENVKSIDEARNIRLMEKNRIKELSLEWNMSMGVRSVEPMELLTELVPPSSVMDFKITLYRDFFQDEDTEIYEDGMNLPYWFMHITKFLPNLVSLEMSGLACSSLPTLVQLSNLRKVVLLHMHNLKEFNTTCSMGEDGANELMLAKLEYLKIDDCPRLWIKPCLPRAAYWYLGGSDNVLSLGGECASSTAASSSSPVSKLKVEHSKLPLHQWRLLHCLPGLSDLTISHCVDLTISPQIARAFSSLKLLSLENILFGRTKLPQWLFELTSLQKLKLKLWYIEEYHENRRQYTQLQSLSLKYCVTLTSLPQWLGELTLLKTLKIDSCEGIISLPESILTNLQELHIFEMP